MLRKRSTKRQISKRLIYKGQNRGKEQGAGSKGQGAGGKEQEARSRGNKSAKSTRSACKTYLSA